jgi:Ca-activated chloride channel homolog
MVEANSPVKEVLLALFPRHSYGTVFISKPREISVMRPYCSSLLILFMVALAQAQQTTPLPGAANPKERQTATTHSGEEVGENEVLRITANLVSVPVSVMDRQGRYVIDLQQKDFRIYEDGAEQRITHFNNVDQPFSVVLLIDTSGSTASFLDQMKTAAKAFVEQLRPSDNVRPVYFHGEVKPLTAKGINDAKALSAAIDQMVSGPVEIGTKLYDAVDFALNALKPVSGRKAVILFTDGENTWGKATAKGTLREAEESDTIVYTLQYRDPVAQKYLQELAGKTGGRFFMAADPKMIRQSFAEVAEELRRQYVIGYHPQEFQKVQERTIKVRVNRKHVVVRSRKTYTYNP